MQKQTQKPQTITYETPTIYSYVQIVEQVANGGIDETTVRDAQSLVANLPIADTEDADNEFFQWCNENGVQTYE